MGPPEHHSLGDPLPGELDAAKVCHRLSLTHALSVHSLATAESWAGEVGTDLHRTGMVFLLDSAEAATELRHARRPQDEGESYVELTRAQLVAMDGAYDILPDGIHARTHPARHAETVRVSPERSWTGYVQAERPSWKDSRSPGCCCGTVA